MDDYDFNPKDSIDLLCSPIRRLGSRINSKRYSEHTGKDNAQHLIKESANVQDQRFNISSSASLILKKTTEREIAQQHSTFSQNNKFSKIISSIPSKSTKEYKHRPLIKVTVIPAGPTKLKKRRSSANKIQSSLSNENFIQAKNVYLVIAGKKREKIYEIKTTGSADFSSNYSRYAKNDETPVDQNITQLLSSLNMDRKKKGKKSKEEYNTSDSAANLDVPVDDCHCSDFLKTRKSRVRITGKIGLTEDDRYVLKCAATVDGKPVETNYDQEQSYTSYPLPPNPWVYDDLGNRAAYFCTESRRISREYGNTCQIKQREANIQVSLDDDNNVCNNNCPLVVIPCKGHRSVETQCAPTNFSTVCFSKIDQLKIVSTNNRDQTVLCNCAQKIGNENPEYESGKIDPAKSCQSPLVIISVYPKQDPEKEIEPKASKSLSPKRNGRQRSPVGRENSPTKSLKSRSPSPSRRMKSKAEMNSKSKGKGTHSVVEVTTNNTKYSRNEKATRETKSKNVNRKNTKEANVQAVFDHSSPTRQKGMAGSKQGQMDVDKLGGRINTNSFKNQSTLSNESRYSTNSNQHSSFDQNENTTDHHVTKDKVSTIYSIEADSLENFLVLSDTRKRSISQTFLVESQSNIDTGLASEMPHPGLAIRDSLEISHRREEKNSILLATPTSDSTPPSGSDSKNKTRPAQVKHFRGDCCDLFNPVERDKEIRELLGIQRPKLVMSTDHNASIIDTREDCSLHCIFRAKRSSNIKTTSINNRFPEVYMASKASECECYESVINNIKDRGDGNDVSQKGSKNVDASSISKMSMLENYSQVKTGAEPGKFKNSSHILNNKENIREKKQDPTKIFRNCKKIQCHKLSEDQDNNKHPLYQQLILNRNINIYLQIEQFTKQKPIMLSRKQYNKVKKTIESAGFKPKIDYICKKVSTTGRAIGKKRTKKPQECIVKNKKPEANKKTQCKTQNTKCFDEHFENKINIKKSSVSNFSDDSFDEGTNEKISTRHKAQLCGNDEAFQDKISKSTTSSEQPKLQISRTIAVGGGDAVIIKKTIATMTKIYLPDKNYSSSDSRKYTSLSVIESPEEYKESDLKIVLRKKVKHLGNSVHSEKKIKPEMIDKQQYVREKTESKNGNFALVKEKECDQSSKMIDKQQYVREKLGSSGYPKTKTKKTVTGKRDTKSKSRLAGIYDLFRPLIRSDQCLDNCCGACGRPTTSHCCGNCGGKTRGCCQKPSVVFLCTVCQGKRGMTKSKSKIHDVPRERLRQASSSTEIHHASLLLTKRVTFSTTDFVENDKKPSVANFFIQNFQSDSLHTIFKGHKRSATPNLGTSAYSLFSDCTNRSSMMVIEEPRPRKPFLRRLMSCLVMKAGTSEVKIGKPTHEIPTEESSIDSYHISTSLGAIELSSSIYDTSASFYSSHSIQPISSKMKRGFLSSVRGFLSNRR